MKTCIEIQLNKIKQNPKVYYFAIKHRTAGSTIIPLIDDNSTHKHDTKGIMLKKWYKYNKNNTALPLVIPQILTKRCERSRFPTYNLGHNLCCFRLHSSYKWDQILYYVVGRDRLLASVLKDCKTPIFNPSNQRLEKFLDSDYILKQLLTQSVLKFSDKKTDPSQSLIA